MTTLTQASERTSTLSDLNPVESIAASYLNKLLDGQAPQDRLRIAPALLEEYGTRDLHVSYMRSHRRATKENPVMTGSITDFISSTASKAIIAELGNTINDKKFRENLEVLRDFSNPEINKEKGITEEQALKAYRAIKADILKPTLKIAIRAGIEAAANSNAYSRPFSGILATLLTGTLTTLGMKLLGDGAKLEESVIRSMSFGLLFKILGKINPALDVNKLDFENIELSGAKLVGHFAEGILQATEKGAPKPSPRGKILDSAPCGPEKYLLTGVPVDGSRVR